MEDFVYIILIIIWLLVSFLRRKPKKADPATTRKPASGRKETTAPEGEVSMEEMLEDFFGTGKKKQEKKPKAEPVYEAAERRERADRSEERRWDNKESASRWDPARDRTEMASDQDPELEKFEGARGVSDDFEFSTEGKIETIDDLIKSHQKEEAMRMAEEEEQMAYHDSLQEFDLRNAVVFSEILNRKYN
ncbi:MAG: hypothetical protein EA394_07060 [Bacteroidia bacterium]|nr:MAG: hypothetical protein EA394_07060 [Bacteroidia bacterium]